MAEANTDGLWTGRDWVWTAGILAWFLCTAVAWAPAPIAIGLDHSWVAVLHHSHGRGLQFGRDLVFTYGPLGFALTNTYYPTTYAAATAVQVLMVAASAIGLAALRPRLFPAERRASTWLTLGWLILIPFFSSTLETPYSLLLLLITWRWVGAGRYAYFVESLLAATLGILSLTKFTYLVATAAVLSLMTFEDLWRWRRFPMSLLLATGAFLAGWLATGQELTGLPTYLRQSWEVARAYTDAMSVSGRAIETLGYGISTVTILLLVARMGWRRDRWHAIPVFGMFSLTLLLIFKAAFVRADGHVDIGFRAAIVAALLVIPSCWHEFPTWRSRWVFLVVLLPILIARPAPSLLPWFDPFVRQLANSNMQFLAAPQAGLEQLRRNHREALARISSELSVPKVPGPVDVYNAEQSLAIAHELNYQPRPIFQSYSAYSEPLLRQNRDFLTGPRAPQTIFWRLEDIDERVPMLMDGLSWPEVLARYEPQGRYGPDGRILRLERRKRPARVEWIPLGVRSGQLGESLALDDLQGRLIWARLRLKPTWLKRLASIVYKPHRASIEFPDGSTFRLIPEMAAAGFLLSPRIENSATFASLYDDAARDSLEFVPAIIVRAKRSEYHSTFDMELSELRIIDDPE